MKKKSKTECIRERELKLANLTFELCLLNELLFDQDLNSI